MPYILQEIGCIHIREVYMLKKIIISAIKYIISGGAIALKAKAIQQDIYKLDNFHTWDI